MKEIFMMNGGWCSITNQNKNLNARVWKFILANVSFVKKTLQKICKSTIGLTTSF
jgi:hypothetical protein